MSIKIFFLKLRLKKADRVLDIKSYTEGEKVLFVFKNKEENCQHK